MMKQCIFPVCTMLLLACCGDTAGTKYPMNIFSETPGSLCTLFVADTIGIEFGDSNYVFGGIAGTAMGPGNELFIVDNIRCSVLRFSPEGEFIGRTGNRGEGPGEFLQPGGIAVSNDGLVCLSDAERGWFCFSVPGEELVFQPHSGRVPMQMQAAPGGGILGIKSDLSQGDNCFETTKTVTLWDEAAPESVITEYLALDYTLTMSDMNEFRRDMIIVDLFPVLAAPGSDFICVVPSPRDEPLILVYERAGQFRDSLLLPYPEIRRSDTELQAQKAFMEEFFFTSSQRTHTVDWEPYPCFPLITSLGVDSLDRIWIQRGFEHLTVFDLFSPEGDYLQTVVVPEVTADMHWEFRIYSRGILAVPQVPESYYCVYRLDPR